MKFYKIKFFGVCAKNIKLTSCICYSVNICFVYHSMQASRCERGKTTVLVRSSKCVRQWNDVEKPTWIHTKKFSKIVTLIFSEIVKKC